MIDGISIDWQISTIKPSTKKVFLFKDKNHSPNSPKHYHLCLPTIDNKYICLVMFSRSYEKIKSQYERIDKTTTFPNDKKCVDSLIDVDQSSKINFVKQKSIINCNSPIYGSLEELKNKIDGSLKVIETNIPADIYNSLIVAVNNSPVVKQYIKQNLKIHSASHK